MNVFFCAKDASVVMCMYLTMVGFLLYALGLLTDG